MDQPTGFSAPELPGQDSAEGQVEPMSLGRRLGHGADATMTALKATDLNFFGHGDEITESYFKLPRAIAVLTWGALSWDPRELPLVHEDPENPQAAWRAGGPELPIEFSRVAVDCRLIPVIDPLNGVPVPTLWAMSRRNDLDAAVADLMKAEGVRNRKLVGFVDTLDNRHRCLAHGAMAEPVKAWARDHGVVCVIWSELPPNFENHTGRPFSPDAAVQHLSGLPRVLSDQARAYLDRAPACVSTPLRRRLADGGWPA